MGNNKWMGNNKPKLNPDKTEFIVIGDDQIRSSLRSSFPVSFLGNIMEPAESVKKLGVILDAENSMQRHMANLCCICYYRLRELRRVRRYLDHEQLQRWQMPWLAVAWITVTHCCITQKGIYWQTTKSSKCLMSYCVRTK